MPNRLASQTSPYLQQHAANPVDWYPWGADALRVARDLDRPILLSVGYSACHWCHVMAHESFEDEAVAAVMNRHFVNIKVDREERPDIDQIYQTAHQMLTQRAGGWPLTMFLAPDQTPFFGGTYFPKTARFGLPGFADLLERVAAIYRDERSAIVAQNVQLLSLLQETVARPDDSAVSLDAEPITAALGELKLAFDGVHGGLGGAPKFPHPAELGLALRQGVLDGDETARQVTLFTLRKMAEGGIYDQLGGGFCRYSVDERWTIPHFEKMLYDNGPLLRLYTDAWLVSGDALFAKVVEQTAAWVLREIQSPEGGYFSSLDADSEHEEGKHYVWTRDEIRSLLSEDEYAVASLHFGLDGPANFEGERWHLYIARPREEVAKMLGIALELAEELAASARGKLFVAREQRVRPGTDDKILTSWNALMIEGMAHAGRVFAREDWLASARCAMQFISDRLWRDGRLLATYKGGRAHLNGYLDDYAFLLAALIELMQSHYRTDDLKFAVTLADILLDQFEDSANGGFFFTSQDHERLILRAKPGPDGATPSGNGLAALSLQRLAHLVGEPRYLAAGERALRLFVPKMRQHPSAFATLCVALAEQLNPPMTVVLRGSGEEIEPWQARLAQRYAPATLVLGLAAGTSGLPGSLDKPVRAGVNAWVCQGVECLPPIQDAAALLRVLQGAEAASLHVSKARESL